MTAPQGPNQQWQNQPWQTQPWQTQPDQNPQGQNLQGQNLQGQNPQGQNPQGQNQPWQPPMYGGYRPMGAPQTGGDIAITRPIEVNLSFAAWLLGAAASLTALLIRLPELHDSADRESSEVAANFVLKWGYITFGIWLVLVAAFVLFTFFMRAGHNWARLTLTALTVFIVLMVVVLIAQGGSNGFMIAAGACAVLGTVLFYVPNSNAYFNLTKVS